MTKNLSQDRQTHLDGRTDQSKDIDSTCERMAETLRQRLEGFALDSLAEQIEGQETRDDGLYLPQWLTEQLCAPMDMRIDEDADATLEQMADELAQQIAEQQAEADEAGR